MSQRDFLLQFSSSETINHVAIAVWNREKSLSYYVEQSDMEIVYSGAIEVAGVKAVYLNRGEYDDSA
ncbi:MAG TPA: hypothetical protein VGN34_30865 [Ktedonobacteraceae bacterium]|jgi:hypothetical protein